MVYVVCLLNLLILDQGSPTVISEINVTWQSTIGPQKEEKISKTRNKLQKLLLSFNDSKNVKLC